MAADCCPIDLATYRKYRLAVQQNAAPGHGDQLAEVESRLRTGLVATGAFARVEVERTKDPDGLVIGVCEIARQVDEQQIVSALEGVWRTEVRYPFWATHCFVVDGSHVEFLGTSRLDNRNNYVTVHLVARHAFVPEPREATDAVTSRL